MQSSLLTFFIPLSSERMTIPDIANTSQDSKEQRIQHPVYDILKSRYPFVNL